MILGWLLVEFFSPKSEPFSGTGGVTFVLFEQTVLWFLKASLLSNRTLHVMQYKGAEGFWTDINRGPTLLKP